MLPRTKQIFKNLLDPNVILKNEEEEISANKQIENQNLSFQKVIKSLQVERFEQNTLNDNEENKEPNKQREKHELKLQERVTSVQIEKHEENTLTADKEEKIKLNQQVENQELNDKENITSLQFERAEENIINDKEQKKEQRKITVNQELDFQEDNTSVQVETSKENILTDEKKKNEQTGFNFQNDNITTVQVESCEQNRVTTNESIRSLATGMNSSQTVEWKIATTCETKIRLQRATKRKTLYNHSSDSEVIDDTDSDPDFDLKSELPKREKKFFTDRKIKKRKLNSEILKTTSVKSQNRKTHGYEHHHQHPILNIGTPIESRETLIENRLITTLEVENTVEPRIAKKRKADPAKWLKNQAKYQRNTGQPYTSTSKSKKEVKAKSVQAPCGDKCRLKCPTKIKEDQRQTIFQKFWELGDVTRQREFISKCLVDVHPEYRYPKHETYRRLNNAFYFTVDGSKIRVCKKYFTATLDIPDRYIRSTVDKTKNGFVETDRRGKHGNHKTVAPEIKDGVRNHIMSIPRIESHYVRNYTKREYIDGGKNLTDLYRDYKDDCVKNNLPYANSVMYARVFNYEFNLSFFQPKKDQCSVCTAHDLQSEDEKQKSKLEHDLHLNEKIFQELKN